MAGNGRFLTIVRGRKRPNAAVDQRQLSAKSGHSNSGFLTALDRMHAKRGAMLALYGCQTFATGSLVEVALLLREKDFDWPGFLEVKSPSGTIEASMSYPLMGITGRLGHRWATRCKILHLKAFLRSTATLQNIEFYVWRP